ncbi:hypothetical protein GALLR39Z86_39580 [Glycomyces algeriensis]|uniref:Uncharacterized protein n=1 Tax=Glycomyces algeriensis TaxID=256037 RepID=A0A9W6GCE1_9ACTN|nr:hypothetical protein GALLR39Z86_39580 [Glycomyces algeriensis]
MNQRDFTVDIERSWSRRQASSSVGNAPAKAGPANINQAIGFSPSVSPTATASPQALAIVPSTATILAGTL